MFCFKVENDIENYMYIKLMKTGKIRLKPGVIPHIFDCQKEQPCAGSSLFIKEEIDIEEPTLDYVKEETDLDVPDIISPDQLRIKLETDTSDIKIKEEILDTNEETIETDTLEYKIKEEILDIKEEIDTPDSTTDSDKKKEELVGKKYCDKAVQVNLNLVDVRTIGIQCCLEEEDLESTISEKRKATDDHKKPKSTKKKIKIKK